VVGSSTQLRYFSGQFTLEEATWLHDDNDNDEVKVKAKAACRGLFDTEAMNALFISRGAEYQIRMSALF
jgi:hypothetical protein